MIDDIAWLGYEPDGDPVYASDYFEQLYTWAEDLIERGLAYVDDQDAEAISAGRGGFGEPGVDSPWRGPLARREPRPVPTHARRRVRRRFPGATGQDLDDRRQHAACATR